MVAVFSGAVVVPPTVVVGWVVVPGSLQAVEKSMITHKSAASNLVFMLFFIKAPSCLYDTVIIS